MNCTKNLRTNIRFLFAVFMIAILILFVLNILSERWFILLKEFSFLYLSCEDMVIGIKQKDKTLFSCGLAVAALSLYGMYLLLPVFLNARS